MKDVRHAIGKDKLLTIATQAGAKYYNLRAVEPYVDYVNIMTYDMEESPNHHSALYRSEMAEEWSCEDAVAAHVAAGFPVGRLVLGIPFYGHGTNEAPELLDYRHIIALDSLQSCWDSAAQVPYMVNSQGHVVVNYEMPNPSHSSVSSCIRKGCWGLCTGIMIAMMKGYITPCRLSRCNESLTLSAYFSLSAYFL